MLRSLFSARCQLHEVRSTLTDEPQNVCVDSVKDRETLRGNLSKKRIVFAVERVGLLRG
jgi:hypothetical protein